MASRMFRRLATLVALTGFTFVGPSNAADLWGGREGGSIKDAPVSAPAGWSGPWISAGVGYGLWSADTHTLNAGTGVCILCGNQTAGGDGIFGNFGIGYDFAVGSNFVLGAFVDYTVSRINGTIQDQGPFAVADADLDHSWAFGARLGYVISPKVMAYVDAGYTRASFSSGAASRSFAPNQLVGTTYQDIDTHGWFVGGGFEVALMQNVFLRSEYRLARYSDEDFVSCTNAGVCPSGSSINFDPIVQTLHTAVVFKLGDREGQSVTEPADPSAGSPGWTGMWASAGIGYGLWSADTHTVSPVTGACVLCENQTAGGDGVFGNFGIGYDFAAGSKFIVGAFADYTASRINGTIQDQGPFAVADADLDHSWAIGARLGYVLSPKVMTFVDGGYTRAHFSGGAGSSTFAPNPLNGTIYRDIDVNGWFVGGGFELALMQNVFLRSEYRLARYGDDDFLNCTTAGVCPAANSINFDPIVQTLHTAVVFKLGDRAESLK